jgi:hypothetical protein
MKETFKTTYRENTVERKESLRLQEKISKKKERRNLYLRLQAKEYQEENNALRAEYI